MPAGTVPPAKHRESIRLKNPAADPVKARMRAIRSLLAVAVLAAGTAAAAEPDHDLSAEAAVKLIKLQTEDHSEQVQIAMIVEGSGKVGPFEVKHLRRVVALHPVPEDGRRVRRTQVYDFCWSQEYGWFTWEKRVERGGDAIWIWSELRGEVVIR